MADKARARKLADRIKVIVAETLELKVKDPRLGFITVTDVRVTGDCQQASVFYTVLGDDSQRADTAEALESAKGVLRSEVGRLTGVRRTPSLDVLRRRRPRECSLHRGPPGSGRRVRRRGAPRRGRREPTRGRPTPTRRPGSRPRAKTRTKPLLDERGA